MDWFDFEKQSRKSRELRLFFCIINPITKLKNEDLVLPVEKN